MRETVILYCISKLQSVDINRNGVFPDQLLSLPADPNVLSILEGYVKNFAANVLCATEEKSKHYSIRDKDKGLPAEKKWAIKYAVDHVLSWICVGRDLYLYL